MCFAAFDMARKVVKTVLDACARTGALGPRPPLPGGGKRGHLKAKGEVDFLEPSCALLGDIQGGCS